MRAAPAEAADLLAHARVGRADSAAERDADRFAIAATIRPELAQRVLAQTRLDRQIWRRPDGRAWRHTWLGGRPWLAGNTLAYWRRTWQRVPFRAVAIGEDTAFVWAPGPRELRPIDDESLVIGTIHPGNTSRKTMRGLEWQPIPARRVRQIMAGDH